MELREVFPVLGTAIEDGDIEKVTQMVTSDNEILHAMTPFGTWLHYAASQGKLEIVKKLIELGLDINTKGGTFKGGALHCAVIAGHIDIVKYLLSCGAEMDVSDSVRNPLFGAIISGNLDIVKLLVESGIDYKVKYSGNVMKNHDALAHARLRGQTEIAEYLETIMKDTHEAVQVISRNDSNPNFKDELLDFIQANYGQISNSIGEIIPGSKVAVTVHIIPANEERNYTTLITTGMSDLPVESPGSPSGKYAELLIKLPADWTINEETIKDSNFNWPLLWLKQIAHMPHTSNKAFCEAMIIPNGEPPKPFVENTKLSSIFVTGLVSETNSVAKSMFKTSRGEIIMFYTLVPIYEEERQLAYTQGPWELIFRFAKNKHHGVIDLNRKNYATE